MFHKYVSTSGHVGAENQTLASMYKISHAVEKALASSAISHFRGFSLHQISTPPLSLEICIWGIQPCNIFSSDPDLAILAPHFWRGSTTKNIPDKIVADQIFR